MSSKLKYMWQALALAEVELRAAMPNPSVGAVIVCDGKIIGQGATSAYGGPHAEVNAIKSVQDASLLPKSTIYVTLEPCSHFGKTPPCADLIVKNNLKKVVIAMLDPNPQVAGKGIEKLEKVGIEVEVIGGSLELAARKLNRRFFTFHEKKRPHILLKWAQTKDGFVDRVRKGETGVNWITQPETKKLVHQWRADEMAILVGYKTALIDNPSLTVREAEGPNPVRVVLDPLGQLPAHLHLFDGKVPTLRYCGQSPETTVPHAETVTLPGNDEFLPEVLADLHQRQLQSVMVEGGAATLQAFIDQELWDDAHVIIGDVKYKEGLKAPALPKHAVVNEYTHGTDRIIIKQRI